MLDILFPLWTFVLIGRPQDYFDFLRPYRLVLVLAIIVFVIMVFFGKFSIKKLFSDKESKLYSLFYLILFLSIPFAYDRSTALNHVAVLYVSNMLFFYIFTQYIDSIGKFRNILFVILFCFFFYSFLTLISGNYEEGRYYSYGTKFDTNDIVFVLISLIPISVFFLRRNVNIISKILAIISIIASIIITLISGSRGGIVSFSALVLYSMIVFRKQIKLKYVLVSLMIFATLISIYSERIDFSRYFMADIETDYNITSESGRLAIWEKGYRIFLSNPITGVGAGCFGMALGDFRGKENILPRAQAAHNSFIQIAVETGTFGIILFSLLIFYSFRNFKRCRHDEIQSDFRSEIVMIAGLLQVGFIGMLVNSLFLSQGYSIFITLYFALSVVIKNIFFEKFV